MLHFNEKQSTLGNHPLHNRQKLDLNDKGENHIKLYDYQKTESEHVKKYQFGLLRNHASF